MPIERFVPEHFSMCTLTRILSNPVGRRASGFVFGDGGAFYFGGGGQSYAGNDVEFLEVTSNTWMQTYPPECLPDCCATDNSCHPACAVKAGIGTTAVTPLGRPYVEHAYHLVTYDAPRHVFFATLTSGTWTWDRQTTQWTLLTPTVPFSPGIQTKTVAYDPGLGTELFFATTQTHKVYTFDWDQVDWVEHDSIPQAINTAEIYSAYDPVARKHLVTSLAGAGSFWLYDAENRLWQQLLGVPAQVLRASSLDYDPVSGVFVVAEVEDDTHVALWTYDVADNLWGSLSSQGTPPFGQLAGRFDTLVYDDVADRVLFMNVKQENGGGGTGGVREGAVETWAYRLADPNEPICVGDCNWDGTLDSEEVSVIIERIFASSTVGCEALDAGEVGEVNAGTLLRALQLSGEGCGRDAVPAS